jgi:hypothetical protein
MGEIHKTSYNDFFVILEARMPSTQKLDKNVMIILAIRHAFTDTYRKNFIMFCEYQQRGGIHRLLMIMPSLFFWQGCPHYKS